MKKTSLGSLVRREGKATFSALLVSLTAATISRTVRLR